MNKNFAKEFSINWVNSWNAHDIGLILSHYTEGVSIESPLALQRFPESKGRITGKSNVKEYWTLGLRLNPDLEFEILNVLTGVNSITIYYLSKASGKKVVETMLFNEELKVYKAIVNYE